MQPQDQDHPRPSGMPPAGQAPPHQFNSVDEAIAAHEQRPVAAAPEQPRKRGGLKLAFASIAALLVLGGGGYAAYAWWSYQRSPEKLFTDMLAKSMTVKTFTQTHTAELVDNDLGIDTTASLTIDSDFSDIKNPKIKVVVETLYRFPDASVSRSGDIIAPGGDRYFMRLTSASEEGNQSSLYTLLFSDVAQLNPIKNTWISVEDTADSGALSSAMFALPIPVGLLNTVRGELIIGNVDEETRGKLLAFQREQQVYKVVSSQEVTLGGRAMVKYNIQFNEDKTIAYNDLLPVPELEGSYGMLGSDIESYELYVDRSTKLLVKEVIIEEDSQLTIEYTNFGQPLNITAPSGSGSVSADEALKRLGLGGL